jgi:hypothetical protein
MAGAQAAGYPVTITRGEGGPLTLPAGVYRIRVTVEDPVNRTSASESGVAHIYGGKETPLEFNFTAAHFMAEIPLTVTANLTLPTGVTADPNSRAIAVYRDEDCTNPTGGFVRRSPDESDSVTFWIPTYEGETVYLRQEFVVGGINMYLGEPYAVEIDFGSPVPPITERYFKVDVEPDIPNGTVEVVSGWAIALPGATITLRVTPNPGYRLRPQSLKYYDGSAYALLASDAVSFDMPRADVTIYAEFVDYGIRYVKESGTGDGSSWENASNNIQKMMDELAVASLDTDTTPRYSGLYIVKVGAGTYKPKYEPMVLSDPAVLGEYPDNGSPASRDAAFMLRPGVQVWGGYPASSEGNDDTRDPATYVTTLSGDLDGDNSIGSGDAYHVVLAVNIPDDGKTVLDGLTISGGYGNGTDDITLNDNPIPRNSGGGIYAYSSALELTNVTVSGNKANDTGGGVYVSGGTFAMSGGTISGNEASSDNPDDYDTGNGGGIYVGNSGTFTMSGGTISGNIATYTDLDPGDPNLSSGNGGGVYVGNSGTFTMSGGTVSGNEASKNGGGVYVETYGTDETFTKTGDSIIYGDTNTTHDSNSDENTAGSGEGHAVYVKTRNSPLKRNTTANSSVVLSNSDTGTGWE